MIGPAFLAQDQLFVPGPAFVLAAADRYRLFAQVVLPVLVEARPVLATGYCTDNGRPCLEPVQLAALSLLQFWERVPEAQAVALWNYHLGWAYAVGWEMGQRLFDSSALCRFRQGLVEHQQSRLLFERLVQRLVQEGWIKGQSARRLDSTFVLGLVSHMGRLECVRETLRLALRELAAGMAAEQRPALWPQWWERYVESQLDYRTPAEVLVTKLRDSGRDMAPILAWLDQHRDAGWAGGAKVQLLRRVFAEQFEPPPVPAPPTPAATPSTPPLPSESPTEGPPPQPKDQTPAGAVKNPHDPQAQWAKKGSGAQKKEVVGYKIQVCETVSEQPLPPGQPTAQFLTAMETQPATASDERGMDLVQQAEAGLNLAPPSRHLCGRRLYLRPTTGSGPGAGPPVDWTGSRTPKLGGAF